MNNTTTKILRENDGGSQIIEEFEFLLERYINLKVNAFIEIGSLFGWTLQHFIHYSEDNSTAISIDLPVSKFVGPNDWRVKKQESCYKNDWPKWAKNKNCKLYLLPVHSFYESTLNSVKKIINDRQIDFLFIDGDHRYDAILKDYNMYSPLVRKGGIIAFHDIAENEDGGPRFWKEIKNNYKHEEIITSKDMGIGILHV